MLVLGRILFNPILVLLMSMVVALVVAMGFDFVDIPIASAQVQNSAQKPVRRPINRSRNRPRAKSAAKKQSKRQSTQGASARSRLKQSVGTTVQKILVRGNKKIETDAVLSKLVTEVGMAFDPVKVRADIEALFKSGFFYNVTVDRESVAGGVQLTYTVVEKPSIAEVIFRGNSEIESTELQTATGIKAYEVLDMEKARDGVEKIQKLYEDKGFFLAHITYKIEGEAEAGNAIPSAAVSGSSVRLTFNIQENDKVKVKRITILGNKHISDGRIKGLLQTQEGGFFSFISSSGSYKQDAFDRDVQLINYLYFNDGYVQAKVDRPQVYVTPDKRGIYITIRVEEGERYKVGNIDFMGDLLFSRAELEEGIEIEKSEWYQHETLLKDIRLLQAKYGDLGYAYANIIPRTRPRDKERELDITFEIDKGSKVYFGRINVVGNTKTRDKVVRRELMVHEGELYNETKKRESLDNIKRLGFFDEVNFNSSTPSENQDLMNIDIAVKERNTGSIQVGAGYSTYSHFIFNGQVNQTNLFGKGQRLGLSIDMASNQSLFNFNFTEPYFLDSDWSVGVDAYQSLRSTTEYEETKRGGAVRVGYPLTRFLRTFVRYKLESSDISLDPTYGDPALFPVPTASDPNPQGNPNGLTSSATLTLEYDKRNDRFMPTSGIYSSVSMEYAGLGGDHRFTKGIGTARFYEKIFWDLVFRNNLTYGFVRSNLEGREPPFNELFILGGANSLRGYDWFSIAKRKRSQKVYDDLITAGRTPTDAERQAWRPFGGLEQLYYQAEIEFPLITEAGIRGVFFYDIGNADDVLKLSSFRSDIGFGFRWFSPIGPLRFEWGFPLERRLEYDERPVVFQFAIGTPF